jgi:hypothetical protein
MNESVILHIDCTLFSTYVLFICEYLFNSISTEIYMQDSQENFAFQSSTVYIFFMLLALNSSLFRFYILKDVRISELIQNLTPSC